MNNWIGIGRATKNVEKHTTANGSAVARFSIAVDRKQKNADGERITDFISVVAFGKIAEIAEQYPDCDVDCLMGGQPLYYYLISVE